MKKIYTSFGKLERDMKVFFDRHKGLIEFAKEVRSQFMDKIDIQIADHYHSVLPLTAETIASIWQSLATYREVEWSTFHYLYYTSEQRIELIDLNKHIPLTTMEVYWNMCTQKVGKTLKDMADGMLKESETNLKVPMKNPKNRSINMGCWDDIYPVSEPGLQMGKDGKLISLVDRGITHNADGSVSGVVVESGVPTFVHIQESSLGRMMRENKGGKDGDFE